MQARTANAKGYNQQLSLCFKLSALTMFLQTPLLRINKKQGQCNLMSVLNSSKMVQMSHSINSKAGLILTKSNTCI